MPVNFDLHHRLELRPSHRQDLTRGFKAEIADPAWFLGRQWQMGEHQGENAASPVLVQVTYHRRPLQPTVGRPTLFPGHGVAAPNIDMPPIVPAEAIIEGETDDWWTFGRRIRIGLAAQAAVEAMAMTDADRMALRLPPLPEPYATFSGGYDGRALFQAAQTGQITLDAALFDGVPTPRRDNHWLPTELKFNRVDFPCGLNAVANEADRPRLTVSDHEGGEVDWWSADAAGDWPALLAEVEAPFSRDVQPVRFTYPGAPHPRWWQIEDAQVDIGGFPPDRSHFASLLLLDLVLAHSDDWFTLPLDAQIGDVVTIKEFVVVDLFKEQFSWSTYPQLNPPTHWSLFKVHDLDADSIVVWPAVAVPVVGEPLEEIALGVDEDANLLWGVEERADGRRLTNREIDASEDPAVEVIPPVTYLYRPSTFVPHHWHPYVVHQVNERRMFVQGRMRDYTTFEAGQIGELTPAPISELLQDDPAHRINPAVVPPQGMRLDRRYVLARQTDGRPVLWVQRQRLPLLSPPVSGLRYDVLKEVK
jgi:hypothetical protein